MLEGLGDLLLQGGEVQNLRENTKRGGGGRRKKQGGRKGLARLRPRLLGDGGGMQKTCAF